MEYNLTRIQFANKLGISRENLKQRMRRGKYKDYYVFENGSYKFRSPEGVRENQGKNPGIDVPKLKRKRVRRGAHYEGKYPNKAFEMHNLNKMMKKLNETDPDFIANYHKYKEIHRREKQSQILDRKKNTFKYYGGPIRNPGFINWSTPWTDLEAKPKDEYDRYLEEELGGNQEDKPKYYW